MSESIHLGQVPPSVGYGSPAANALGSDAYIHALLSQGGLDNDALHLTTSSNGGTPLESHSSTGSRLNTFLKWTGIIFAGAMAFFGLRSYLASKAPQAAETVAEATQAAASK